MPGIAHDAEAHATGLQGDTTVKLMLVSVELLRIFSVVTLIAYG